MRGFREDESKGAMMDDIDLAQASHRTAADPNLWLCDFIQSVQGRRMLGLAKRRMNNYQAVVISELSTDGIGYKTSILIGNLGAFLRNDRGGLSGLATPDAR